MKIRHDARRPPWTRIAVTAHRTPVAESLAAATYGTSRIDSRAALTFVTARRGQRPPFGGPALVVPPRRRPARVLPLPSL